jgi:hypothetical protein
MRHAARPRTDGAIDFVENRTGRGIDGDRLARSSKRGKPRAANLQLMWPIALEWLTGGRLSITFGSCRPPSLSDVIDISDFQSCAVRTAFRDGAIFRDPRTCAALSISSRTLFVFTRDRAGVRHANAALRW